MQSEFSEKINKLEQIFTIKTQNQELFNKALIHSSFTKENDISLLENYERLEFLGDSVLKLCISDILYKKFPKYLEGDLTRIRSIIISDNMLAEVAKQIGIAELIVLGKQEEKMGGRERKSIIACVFEAILGAYYLEGKFAEVSAFLERTFQSHIKDVDEHFEKFNAKAVLQEYTQSHNKKLPEYSIVEELGPEHDKIFVVEVSYMDDILASGRGKTKREAEQECAYKACVKLGVVK